MLNIFINENLKIEVDYKKVDCNQESAHCHVVRGDERVAKVLVNPVKIESGHSLEQNENFKVDELSIWKKMEEKLSNALK